MKFRHVQQKFFSIYFQRPIIRFTLLAEILGMSLLYKDLVMVKIITLAPNLLYASLLLASDNAVVAQEER